MTRGVGLLLVLSTAAACQSPDPKSRGVALKPDYPQATYQQAYAYAVGRQGALAFQPSFVVVHVAQGYFAGTISWFQDPASGVSAHYVVGKSGAVTQMVEEKDTAYHVGAAISVTSIGIEHEGFVEEPAKWFTDSLYAGSAALVKNIAERWGLPLDRCHILGHDQVPDPKNPCLFGGVEHHTDPGAGWDWVKYMGYIGGGAAPCTWSCTSKKGSLVGVVRSGSLLPAAPPIAGAKVSIVGASTFTDAKGFYRFDNLDIGYYYAITASAPGYQSVTQNQAIVMPLDNYSNFALPPAGPSPEAGPALPDAGPQVDQPARAADRRPGPPASDTPSPDSTGTTPADADSPGVEPVQSSGSGGCSLTLALGTEAGGPPAGLGPLLLGALGGLALARRGRASKADKRQQQP